MNYVFDIDGTLSFDGKTIHEDIVTALETLQDKGHKVIFASARPIRDMVSIVPESFQGGTWIGGNGTYIKEGDNIKVTTFNEDDTYALLELLEGYESDYMIDGKWDYTYKGSINHPLYKNINKEIANNINLNLHDEICKIVIFEPHPSMEDYLTLMDLELHYHTNENLIDISPLNCDKHNALIKLGIKDYIAFGNDANDINLFRNALYSYCVGDGEHSKYASKSIKKSHIVQSIKDSISLISN